MIIFQNENIIILLNSKYSEVEILSPEIQDTHPQSKDSGWVLGCFLPIVPPLRAV